jgi:DNA-binding protein HU-beta
LYKPKEIIIDYIAEKTGITKRESNEAINMMIQYITNNLLTDNKVHIPALGIFELRPRLARKARNPHTGEQVDVPPRNYVRFRSSKKLLKAVNN